MNELTLKDIHELYFKEVFDDVEDVKTSVEGSVRTARDTSVNASPKLSGYHVGATLTSYYKETFDMCETTGWNTEFDIHSCTIHAEQMALAKYLPYQHEKELLWVVVYSKSKPPYWPCGLCRQCLFEYFGPDLVVISCNDKDYRITTINEILPQGFRKVRP